jgi:hypothetical protein
MAFKLAEEDDILDDQEADNDDVDIGSNSSESPTRKLKTSLHKCSKKTGVSQHFNWPCLWSSLKAGSVLFCFHLLCKCTGERYVMNHF